MTRLDEVCRKHEISTAALIAETKRHDPRRRGYSKNHLYAVRRGQAEPTRQCMGVILDAMRSLTGQRLAVEDLFDFKAKPSRTRRAS